MRTRVQMPHPRARTRIRARTGVCVKKHTHTYNQHDEKSRCKQLPALAPGCLILRIVEDKEFGPNVKGLTEIETKTAMQCMEHFSEGVVRRRVSSTEKNAESSRSHALLLVAQCSALSAVLSHAIPPPPKIAIPFRRKIES